MFYEKLKIIEFWEKSVKYHSFWCPICFAQCTKYYFVVSRKPLKVLLYCTVWTPKSLIILHALCEPLKVLLYCTVWTPKSLIIFNCVNPWKTYLYCTVLIPQSLITLPLCTPLKVYSYCTVWTPESLILRPCTSRKVYHIALCEPLKL